MALSLNPLLDSTYYGIQAKCKTWPRESADNQSRKMKDLSPSTLGLLIPGYINLAMLRDAVTKV